MSAAATDAMPTTRVVLCGNSLCTRGLETHLRLLLADHEVPVELLRDPMTDSEGPIAGPVDAVVACASVCTGTQGSTLYGEIKVRYPGAHLIAISPKVHATDLVRAMESGAVGLIACGIDDPADLPKTIMRVVSGEIAFSNDVSRILVEAVRASAVGQSAPPSAAKGWGITDREQHVLALLCDGLTNHQIAVTLGLSANTVKNHLASIYRKLDAASRGEAISIAMRIGLI